MLTAADRTSPPLATIGCSRRTGASARPRGAPAAARADDPGSRTGADLRRHVHGAQRSDRLQLQEHRAAWCSTPRGPPRSTPGPGGPLPNSPDNPAGVATAVVPLPLTPSPKPDQLSSSTSTTSSTTRSAATSPTSRGRRARSPRTSRSATRITVNGYGVLHPARQPRRGAGFGDGDSGTDGTVYPGDGPTPRGTVELRGRQDRVQRRHRRHPARDDGRRRLPPDSRAGSSPHPALRIIPASARPAAPKVSYVVPSSGGRSDTTQRLDQQRAAGSRACACTSSGRGGRRASSRCSAWSRTPGAESPSPPALPERLSQYVTQWGLDPVYAIGPAADHVPDARRVPRRASRRQPVCTSTSCRTRRAEPTCS